MFFTGFAVAQSGEKCQKDTVIMLGKKKVCSEKIQLTKNNFLKSGKITVNQPGCSVSQFTYSMFSLGSSIRKTVYDSMFPAAMKKMVRNPKINYRYINLEGVQIKIPGGQLIAPKVDTVKVKFIYP